MKRLSGAQLRAHPVDSSEEAPADPTERTGILPAVPTERSTEKPPSGVARSRSRPRPTIDLGAALASIERGIEVPHHVEDRVVSRLIGRKSWDTLDQAGLGLSERIDAVERHIDVPKDIEDRIVKALLARRRAERGDMIKVSDVSPNASGMALGPERSATRARNVLLSFTSAVGRLWAGFIASIRNLVRYLR